MALLRAGFVVAMMFIFLLVAPVSVLGGSTGLLDEQDSVSGILLRGTNSGGELGSPDLFHRGFSGRKMLAAGRPVEASGPGSEASTEQLVRHESTVDSTVPPAETQSTSTAPAPPAHFAARFAFLFRSLAKGSSPPSTGTPSPGHN